MRYCHASNTTNTTNEMNFFKAVPYHLARYICVENDFMPSVTTLYIGIILIMFVCMCVYIYV